MHWLAKLMAFRDINSMYEGLVEKYPLLFAEWPSEIAIVGASSFCESIINGLQAKGVGICGVYDQNEKICGSEIGGLIVRSFSEMGEIGKDVPVILATHRLLALKIKLSGMGFVNVWPFPLLAIADRTYFSPHPFYLNLLEDLFDSRERLYSLHDRLGDERSKMVLDALIGFRLTLDPLSLNGLVDQDPYFCLDLVTIDSDEVIVDGGAYVGDSVEQLVEITSNKFKYVIPFEPSVEIYEILKNKFNDDVRVKPYRACLYNENTTLCFDGFGKRHSSITNDEGGGGCPAVAIDSLEESADITFIKLNIEAAEPEAIEGAKKTIAANHPKLAVAVYHRPDHLWSIVDVIDRIYPGYTFYLRQHDGGIIETVLYAVDR